MSVKYSKKYDLQDVYKNDSVNTFSLTFTDSEQALIDMTGAEVTMTFLLQGKEYRTLSTATSGVVVAGSVATITIPPFTIAWQYSYDIQVVKDWVKRTYIYWNVLVHNEITKW